MRKLHLSLVLALSACFAPPPEGTAEQDSIARQCGYPIPELCFPDNPDAGSSWCTDVCRPDPAYCPPYTFPEIWHCWIVINEKDGWGRDVCVNGIRVSAHQCLLGFEQ